MALSGDPRDRPQPETAQSVGFIWVFALVFAHGARSGAHEYSPGRAWSSLSPEGSGLSFADPPASTVWEG